jgi:hypothetical protein
MGQSRKSAPSDVKRKHPAHRRKLGWIFVMCDARCSPRFTKYDRNSYHFIWKRMLAVCNELMKVCQRGENDGAAVGLEYAWDRLFGNVEGTTGKSSKNEKGRHDLHALAPLDKTTASVTQTSVDRCCCCHCNLQEYQQEVRGGRPHCPSGSHVSSDLMPDRNFEKFLLRKTFCGYIASYGAARDI